MLIECVIETSIRLCLVGCTRFFILFYLIMFIITKNSILYLNEISLV